jgi:molybdenum-dependent DNA-binding transcriptional regulator ModE
LEEPSRNLKGRSKPVDRLESMSVFVAVVAAGSFSAASRQLRMPLPTVSRKVAEIESHLNAKLLVRSTRKLVLTEAGQAYVEDCRRILEAVSEAERDASGQYNAPQGELSITAPIVFGRLHVVAAPACAANKRCALSRGTRQFRPGVCRVLLAGWRSRGACDRRRVAGGRSRQQ